MIDNVVGNQFSAITKQKEKIKAAMVAKNTRREKSRAIESADRRIVHFIFDPSLPREKTPFTQKFSQLMSGTEALAEAEENLSKACDEYIDKIEQEQLDPESDPYPFKFDNNEFHELELNDLQRLSFGVADNPFIKADVEKFYPEIHVISGSGEVLATINPTSRSSNKFNASTFCDNFRDDKLKINDDRKVKLTLSDFQKERNIMILLTVRAFDSNEKADPAQYREAWFRLQNEDTNQTLDYAYVRKVDLPEGYEEEAEAAGEAEEAEEGGGEDGAQKPKNQLIYLAGRLFREEIESKSAGVSDGEGEERSPRVQEEAFKWVYERWNKAITTDQYPNIEQTLAGLHARAREEIGTFENRVTEAKAAVAAAAEKRKQDMLAAAKKAKGAKGKKKKGEEPPPEEEEVAPVQIEQEEAEEAELDLTDPAQFKKALRQRAPRPFTFGPIEFRHLNLTEEQNPFDDNKAR